MDLKTQFGFGFGFGIRILPVKLLPQILLLNSDFCFKFRFLLQIQILLQIFLPFSNPFFSLSSNESFILFHN